MFVRRRRDISEQHFPEDLSKLGYFINEKDEIRQIANPNERFEYKFFRAQRLNELRREAFISCFRTLILERLTKLGLRILKLSQDNNQTHIPILHTPDLPHNTNKLLLLLADENVDLGIWSIRGIDGENGTFRTGTMEAIVARAIEEGYSVIIGNSGALFFDPDRNTTVTASSFSVKLKPWNLGGKIRHFDPTWNVVKGSEDPTSHVQTVFEKVVNVLIPKQTKIFVLAAGTGAGGVVEYFEKSFSDPTYKWSTRVAACAFAEPTYSVSALTSSPLKIFLNKLARAYIVHGEAMGTQVADLRFGCSTFSANTLYHECIIPLYWEGIMEYFELARKDPEWCNPAMVFETLVVDGEGEDGVKEAMEKVKLAEGGGHVWGDGSTPGCGW